MNDSILNAIEDIGCLCVKCECGYERPLKGWEIVEGEVFCPMCGEWKLAVFDFT